MISIHNKNSQFENSPIILGENNKVVINNSGDQKIDWESLQDELIKVTSKLPKTSKEYNLSKEALNYAMREEERGFRNVLKKNIESFTSSLFSGVASGALIEIIKTII